MFLAEATWPRTPTHRAIFLALVFFGSKNFGSRYVRKSIKGSKDLDDNLLTETPLSQKMPHWFGAQSQMNFR